MIWRILGGTFKLGWKAFIGILTAMGFVAFLFDRFEPAEEVKDLGEIENDILNGKLDVW